VNTGNVTAAVDRAEVLPCASAATTEYVYVVPRVPVVSVTAVVPPETVATVLMASPGAERVIVYAVTPTVSVAAVHEIFAVDTPVAAALTWPGALGAVQSGVIVTLADDVLSAASDATTR
jgi:hypothetical protein